MCHFCPSIVCCHLMFFKPFNSQDQIVNSPLWQLNISRLVSYKNLVLDQDKKLYLISASLIITCLKDNVWKLWGEVIF